MLKGSKQTKETREKMSESHTGLKQTEITKRKIRKAMKGKGHPQSEATRKMLSEVRKGEKSSNWQGGITLENEKVRKNVEYRLWREAVFARDNWTCQKYGTKGGKLHPHHIRNFAQFPELRFAIDNGITLSEKAQKEFHKKYGRKNNTREQLEEFLS